VSVLELALSGNIPATLIVKSAELKSGERQWTDVMSDPVQFREVLRLIEPVVIAAFVEPLVSKEGDETHLALDEVDAQDRMAVFQWCNEGAAALQSFRGESEDGVEPVSNGKIIGDEAE
jgi:hypothetical protein